MTDHDDDQLEAAFRDGLQRLGEGAAVTAPVAARARAAARRRRQSRVAMGVAAASVAAIAIAGFVVSRDNSDTPPNTPLADSSPSELGQPVNEWRTEYWHDMQVDVPADWAYGAAPDACGVGAVVGPDGGLDVEYRGTPYVGRPISNTDICGPPDLPPTAPYVWLDADIEPGVVDVGDGYVQETVEVNGSLVTVATQDEQLRRQILASATGGETCMSNLDQPPRVESMLTEGMGEVESAQVCAYVKDGSAFDLVYATTLDTEDATAYDEGASRAPRVNDPGHCSAVDEYVVITLTGDDPFGDQPVTKDTVVNPGCGGLVEVTPSDYRTLTEDARRAWSRNGLQAVLSAFIGPMG